MDRSKLVPVFAALLLVAMSGCAALDGGEEGPKSSEEAQRVQQQAMDAMASIDSYRVEMSMQVESQGRTVSMAMDSLVDRAARKMEMNMTIDAPMGSQAVTMYIRDQTAYINSNGGWETREYEQDIWDEQDRLEQQRELLNHSTVTLAGNDTVDGEAVRVMELDPDRDKLEELVVQQPGANIEDIDIDSISYTYYVSQETNRLRKMEMDATISANGNSGDISMTMTVSDYGTNATVDIPEDVSTAPAA